MTARITAADAKRLGLDVPAPTRPRATRKTARGPYRTRCTTCRDEFTTQASEDRHLVATGHHRYEIRL